MTDGNKQLILIQHQHTHTRTCTCIMRNSPQDRINISISDLVCTQSGWTYMYMRGFYKVKKPLVLATNDP